MFFKLQFIIYNLTATTWRIEYKKNEAQLYSRIKFSFTSMQF